MDNESKDFKEMISHLQGVIERSGAGSVPGELAPRQINKIESFIKIKEEAKKIKARGKRDERVCST